MCRTLACADPSVVKNDPWWLDPKDPHRGLYVQQGLLGPTVPNFWVYNPVYAQVQNDQATADKAFKRHYDDDTIAELTMIIAWENSSSRFNRALRIPSQGFWQR